MNIKEFIQSGIIENYVLGLADQEDVAQVNELRMQYPEVAEAITAFEIELEEAAFQNAAPVPENVKENIFSTLGLNKAGTDITNPSATVDTAQVVAIPARESSFAKYFAAASLILLIGSAILNVYTYSKYKKLVAVNNELAIERNRLYANNTTIQTRLNEADKNLQIISGNDMVKVPLAGVPGKAPYEAVVYWSKSTKDVYLMAKDLPAAPAGKQYQLWALADGKPIDAGVLGDCASICKLKNIQIAQAFAITLEKEGGSPTPTLDQMYVIGKL